MVSEPYAVVVPRSKRYIVALPQGLTQPLSVAVVMPRPETEPVVALGGSSVVNATSPPLGRVNK